MSLKFKVFTTIVIIIGISTFSSLGFWQLGRMQEKTYLQKMRKINQGLAAADFDAITNLDNALFRTVKLTGNWQESEAFFLDLRKHNGRIGMQLVMPFITQKGKKVLVNRGWIQHEPANMELPKIKTILTNTRITGLVTESKPAKFDFSNSNRLKPRRMFIALDKLQEQDQKLANIVILQTQADIKDSLIRKWQLKEFNPQMHLAYAIQWFAFAMILAVVSIYLVLKQRK